MFIIMRRFIYRSRRGCLNSLMKRVWTGIKIAQDGEWSLLRASLEK